MNEASDKLNPVTVSTASAGSAALVCSAPEPSAGGWHWWRIDMNHAPMLAMVYVFDGMEPQVKLHNRHGAETCQTIPMSKLGGIWGGAVESPEIWRVPLPPNAELKHGG